MNFRLCALVAMGLSLLVVPGLHAQQASSAASATIRGDVDGDGRVTRADADALRAYLVRGTLPAGRSILPAGDANGDGRVTAADATLISRFAAGVDVSRFPVGRPVSERVTGGSGGRAYISTDYECIVDVVAGSTDCRVAGGGAGGAGGARLDVVAGTGPLTFVSSWVHKRTITAGMDTSVNTVAFTNNMGQPIGTTDGMSAHPDGNRLFFTTPPYVVAVKSGTIAGASIALVIPDDTASFTNTASAQSWPSRPYYQYDGIVAPSATSGSREIQYVYTENVRGFGFNYRVWTPVQFEHGRIIISPDTVPVLAPAETDSLTGTAYNAWGQVSDTITWSSSNTAVATVNATTGKVTAVDSGTVTITATSTANSNRKGTRTVTVDRFPTLDSTSPADSATGVLPGSSIVLTFSEPVDIAAGAFTLECPDNTPQAFTVGGGGTNTITLDPTGDLPAATVCVVTVDGNKVTDSDSKDGPDMMPGNRSFSFETAIQAMADSLTGITGNIRINTANTSPVLRVTTNDKITPSTVITFAGWGPDANKSMAGGNVTMTMSGDSMGQFIYNPPAGFTGTDSLGYVIQGGGVSDTGKVALKVSGMIWFVGGGGSGTPCVNPNLAASDLICGRLTNPYPTLADFQADNTGAAGRPGTGHPIFIYEGTHAGSVTLRQQQRLIGQDAAGDLATLAGIAQPAAGSDALPALTPGGATVRINGTVTLGADNHLRGVNIFAGSGAALVGTNIGTPVIVDVDSLSATGGAVLDLNGGTVNSTFVSVTSTGSPKQGISLRSINGTLTFGGGSISDADSAAFLVSGGNVGFTWPGSIGQANNAPLVDVQGSHTGTLTFSGALTATNGTGLQFNAAQGTYTFSGSAGLGGTDAGVDITNGSGGTFSFGTGTAITNSAGTGVNVYGSAATVTYSGSITKSGTSTGRLVEVGEQTGGTVTFNTGTLLANSTSNLSTGISLSNADGTVSFDGTTTLNGGDAGIDLLSGTGGTVTFSANTLVQNPTGTAFNVNASAPNVTFNGSLIRTANNALLVDLTTVASGTITFDPAAGTDSVYATIGDGIQLSNADGAVDFNGRVRLAGGNAGVDIINGSSGNIDFDAATIMNPTGEALRIFNGSGGDQAADVSFAGSITTNAGRPVLIEDVSSGSVAVSASINATAGQGIMVQNNSGGTFTFSNATQTLNTAANAAVSLLNNTGATVNFTGGALTITTAAGAGVNATGGGTVNVTGSANTVSTGTGTAVNIANTNIGASGVTFRSVSANGAASGIVLNATGNAAGLTVTGNGAAGTGGTIQNTTGAGISLTNTTSPSFSRMIVQNTGSHGIYGALVNNFSLTNSTVTVSGTTEVAGRQESNLSFYQNAGTGLERNVTGTVTITGNTLNNALHHGINITQYDGTISSLNISNNTFTSATASSGSTTGATTSHGSAISINPIGSGSTIASVTSATISNNTITGFPGNAGILFIAGNTNVGGPAGTYGTAADSITIQSNRIRGHSSANLMNTQAVNIAVGARGTGFFRVLDNGTVAEPITNMAGHAITASALGQATLGIRLTNNRIVANNTVGSQGISMGVDTAANFATTAVLNATVNSNAISATHGSGIFALATRRGTMNAKILSNSVAAPASGTYGIQLVAATTLANTGTGCFSISGNTTAGGVNGGTTFPGIGLRRQSGAATAPNVFGIVGLPGGSTATPNVENYVNSSNTSTSGTFGVGGTALISASNGFTSCTLSF